jgi:hypothetical protein
LATAVRRSRGTAAAYLARRRRRIGDEPTDYAIDARPRVLITDAIRVNR